MLKYARAHDRVLGHGHVPRHGHGDVHGHGHEYQYGRGHGYGRELCVMRDTHPCARTRARTLASILHRYAQALHIRLGNLPLAGWAAQRWQDIALGIQWLLDHAPQGEESLLLDLLNMLHRQGADWETWFNEGIFAGAGIRGANGHNVNNAQALKSAAVLYRATGAWPTHLTPRPRICPFPRRDVTASPCPHPLPAPCAHSPVILAQATRRSPLSRQRV